MIRVTTLPTPPSDFVVDSGHTAKAVAELEVSEITIDGGEVLTGSAVDDPREHLGSEEFPCAALSGGGVADGVLDDDFRCVAAESQQLECPAHARELGAGIHEGREFQAVGSVGVGVPASAIDASHSRQSRDEQSKSGAVRLFAPRSGAHTGVTGLSWQSGLQQCFI